MTRVVIALGLAIVFGGAGDVLMSLGMKRHGAVVVRRPRDIPPVIRKVFTNPFILAGVVSMAIYFGSFLTAMAWVDVSVVIPLTSLSYVLTAAYAHFFMHEQITPMRWVGVVILTTGAAMVGFSS